ncbi:unnamed protein product [Euphydryas editha]|uniref:CCC domain-containing protein n=2 Tax=Euphydryas editha TaxID=104508 RepID=A0AAU9U568_EUPED|nr:unnamed protein product [Euphydryas editha]
MTPLYKELNGVIQCEDLIDNIKLSVPIRPPRKSATRISYEPISRTNVVPETRVGCGVCSRREMEYCETRVLADHCCCERHYLPEPFPWLPHTCYVGPHRCRPLAQDCVRYTRLRDCCCYKKLAERWKSILSNSSRLSVGGVSLLLLSMLLFVAHL